MPCRVLLIQERELKRGSSRKGAAEKELKRGKQARKHASKQAGKQARRQAGKQALGRHSVGAMPWRGLLFPLGHSDLLY